MDYKQAKAVIDRFYKKNKPEGELAQALMKAVNAINDCIELGLNGKGD